MAVFRVERNKGYITRQQGRDNKGKMTAIEYTIFEQPQPPTTQPPGLNYPILENPTTANPILENPTSDNPVSENPTVTQAKPRKGTERKRPQKAQ